VRYGPTAHDPEKQGYFDVPRAPRGRRRGQHRRPKTHHLPAAVGSIALATAAAGALTLSGPASAALGAGARPTVTATPEVERAPVLNAKAVAAALAIRSQDTVERSTQREQLTESVLAAKVEQELADAASLDALAGDRLVRFAEAPVTWVVPVQGYRLTSLYGPRWGRPHTGLDMAAASGTPIYAMSAGEIISAEYEGGYGNKTIIRHEDGTETWYCHQSGFELTSGSVEAGEVIGYVGSTGNSTGPHLHLEVHPDGSEDYAINPLTWMRDVLGLTV